MVHVDDYYYQVPLDDVGSRPVTSGRCLKIGITFISLAVLSVVTTSLVAPSHGNASAVSAISLAGLSFVSRVSKGGVVPAPQTFGTLAPASKTGPSWPQLHGEIGLSRGAQLCQCANAQSSWESGRNLVATNTARGSNDIPVNKKIAILGSTGSIGTQTLDICRKNVGMFIPVALAAGKNVKLLLEQVKEFKPELVSCDESVIEELKKGVSALGISDYHPQLLSGTQGTIEVAKYAGAQTVVTGIVGTAGLIPTIEAIKAKKDIALANKETLIAGGPVIAPMFEEYGVSMLPVDSEHSAIFQCLQGVPKGGVKKIILTGSGGTFRDMSVEDMKNADPEYLRQKATTHPNWDMGAKITVDSSTMMNKGLEVIEAHWLYGVDYDNIEVVIHPQSIVHSAIECQDTAVLMQTGWPDMRLPILYALSYPSRVPADLPNPRDGRSFDDWWKGNGKDGKIDFYKPDLEKYPCIALAYKAGRRGGTMPAILSAANEKAVELLLDKELDFLEIPATLDAVMNKAEEEDRVIGAPSLDDIVNADRWAREAAAEVVRNSLGTARSAAHTKDGPANPKRFINEESKVVQDALDGLIWASPNLGRLDTYPDVKVVYRTDWDKSKVAIISGGGAGHEPLHGGFVGAGMLTAAISGETFASPSIEAVLSAIVHVTGSKGCIVIIKNYTGDRLNFALAAEQARNQFGLDVEIVITKDDVATVAERGIAGTLFVHKVAGALSEDGADLSTVKKAAQKVIANSASMGVALSSVVRLKPEMIEHGKMEVGLGIHGEPGARTEVMAPSAKVVDIIMEGIMAAERMAGEAPDGYACLINNLGSVPPLEMCIVTADLMKSKWASNIKLLIGPQQLCTSLDMNGVSISALRLDSSLRKLLEAPTVAPAWPGAVVPKYPKPAEGIKGLDPLELHKPSKDDQVSEVLEAICKKLIASKKYLDGIDAKVGDADCGTTMETAAQKVLAIKDELPMADPKAFCQSMGAILSKVMGGSSGVLMAIMWSGMATSFQRQIDAGVKNTWRDAGPKAFRDGLQAMMDAGGASLGSRTMLDALVPAADEILAGNGFAGAKAAAEAGADATKHMRPRAGRAENVPESIWTGVPDPGAMAVALAFGELA